MTEKTENPRIRIDATIFTEFAEVRDTLHLSGQQANSLCLAVLLQAYKQREIDHDTLMRILECTPEEIEEINQALALEYVDIWDSLRRGLLMAIRRDTRLGAHVIEDPQERKQQRSAAYPHIHQVVTAIMAANEQAQHSMDVQYISPYIVRKIAHANPVTVTAYFRDYQTEIDAHNQSHGIGSDTDGLRHNLLRAKFLKLDTEEARVAFVAKHGEWFTRNGVPM
jgi:hypothetical protein